MKRTIGPAGDAHFRNASRICNASDPAMFEFGTCSVLINCVFENLSEVFKASLGSGTSIAALLPTILALVGSPPLEIVQLTLLSPHRALATCCFTIGLPSGLFRQLRPLHTQLSHKNPREPRMREWVTPLPCIGNARWHNILAKVAMDTLIVSLASIMLWRNWVVSSFTMVPWRCEYSWLLFAWPLACMLWLVVAVGLLLFMKESMEVYNGLGRRLDCSVWDLISVPYTFTPNKSVPGITEKATLPVVQNATSKDDNTTCGAEATKSGAMASKVEVSADDRHTRQAQSKTPSALPVLESTPTRSDTLEAYDAAYIRVCITMPSNFGLRSWCCYEAAIETLAVGIYLYATFVLTSTLFLNADQAIIFATVMTLCLSAVRILTTVF